MKFFQGWSKKLIAFLVYVSIVLLNKKMDLGLNDTELIAMTGGLGAYTIGQGLSDLGKEKARIEVNGKKR